MSKEIMVTIPREEFYEVSKVLLAESFEDKNNISVYTQKGAIIFGVDRTVTQVKEIAGFYPEEDD